MEAAEIGGHMFVESLSPKCHVYFKLLDYLYQIW